MARIPYTEIEKHFSAQRLNKYRFPSNNNKTKTLKLYKANLLVSRSFYPLLSVFEIVTRNSIYNVLASYFNDTDWIINQQNGFMSDNSLRRGSFYLRTEVARCIQKLTQNQSTITSGKVIAEQTFGFWTSLLEPYHFRLIRGKTLDAFPNRLRGYGRSDVLKSLKKIQKFRNRIYHNEPICFVNNQIDFSQALEIHQEILEVIAWIDTTIINWTKDLDDVLKEIQQAQQI